MAIAKDENELKEFSQSMNELGFKETDKITDLLSHPKSYLVAEEDMSKNIYDFAIQYPSGQVEMFDKNHMNSRIFSPDYKNNVVLLINEKVLNKLLAEGLDLLSAAGPAYRS